MEPIIRAIAALANNRGGFVFIGVGDPECRVVGMPDTAFQNTDIVRITDKAKTLLTPTPSFSKDVIEVGGHAVGVLFVEKYPTPPVIVCRDANGLEDGAILFRYPGQSGKIKFGDLLAMLRERDRAATHSLLASASRLSEIGTDRALIVDTEKGELDAGSKRIVIDRSLADQLDFIREGEFDERAGARALRLVGDVHAVDPEGQVIERVEGRALDADAVLRAYLSHEAVRAPLEYVCISAKFQRQWLPLFYFVRLAGGTSTLQSRHLTRRMPSIGFRRQMPLNSFAGRGPRSNGPVARSLTWSRICKLVGLTICVSGFTIFRSCAACAVCQMVLNRPTQFLTWFATSMGMRATTPMFGVVFSAPPPALMNSNLRDRLND